MDRTPIHWRRGPTCLSPWRGISGYARARTRARTKARERDSISRRREKSARARCTLVAHHLPTRRVIRRGSRLSSARHGRRLPHHASLVNRPSDQPSPRLISRTPVLHVIARNRQTGDRSQCAVWSLFRSSIATRGTCIGSLSRADNAPCARRELWGSVIDLKEIGEEETEATKCKRQSKEERQKELFLRESSDNRDRDKCRTCLVSSV